MGARLTWNQKVVCSIHTGFIFFSVFCFVFMAFQTLISDPRSLVLLFFDILFLPQGIFSSFSWTKQHGVSVNELRIWPNTSYVVSSRQICGQLLKKTTCGYMEFDSGDDAKKIYDEYARSVGFKMRIDQCRGSQVDKKIISCKLSCNKEGYYTKAKNQFGQIRKQHTNSRQGCNAIMLEILGNNTFFVLHTCKEGKIQALTAELKHQDKLIKFYREHLSTFLGDLDQQTEILSTKIQVAVDNMRDRNKRTGMVDLYSPCRPSECGFSSYIVFKFIIKHYS
ncbi:far-red impaired responsive (FAR1) family protein [Artemisia annua]|uniref:Far-red impaired responsive (FAR1) family protein n=1 Tax=Artemisia annua TaxID=35608 RepID=A0A2U1LJ37_ARTAN|nr:far-red impaired responsive (FAR1) family protein [Artemisia annua]